MIGGPSAGAGNLISGNGPEHQGSGVLAGGVVISGAFATGNILQGNQIGTDAAGAMALPNYVTGVTIVDAPNSLIGGTKPGEGNLISANAGTGLNLVGAAEGTVIEGNLIGTDRAGTSALGNLGAGVGIDSNGITVGGTVSGEGNVISGNGEGIVHRHNHCQREQRRGPGESASGRRSTARAASGTPVRASRSWRAASSPVPIRMSRSAPQSIPARPPTRLGAAANTIAFNRTGIESSPFTFGLTYLANSIYANSGLAIDIVPDGVNPNDKNDGTGFGNKTQNYPELTSAAERWGSHDGARDAQQHAQRHLPRRVLRQ